MNLAYNLDDEQIFKMKDETQAFVDKVVSLEKYKDAKIFVDVVNNKKIFIQALFLLESVYRKKIKNNEEISLDKFSVLINIFENKIDDIKHNPKKNMKRRYLRLDTEQLNIFEFIKLRYSQIMDKDNPLTKNIANDFATDSLSKSNKIENKNNYDNMSRVEFMQFILGISYCYYKGFDADFITPVAKKIIKEAVKINHKYNLSTGLTTDFEVAKNTTSIIFKKALEKLAK